MHKVFTAIFLLIGFALISSAEAQDIDLTGYTLTFHDEFTESTLNLSNYGPISTTEPSWIAHTPYGGDFGDGGFVTSAYSINNGILSIKAQNTGSGWTCGLLSTVDTSYNGFSQTYGYFEARMLLPAGMGTWPAFWLGGIVPSGTPSPEIDVFEMYGNWPTIVHETYHTWLNNQETQVNYTTATISDTSVNWHIYGVLVTPIYITWYIDGNQVFQIQTPAAAKVPLYMMVDYALGGGWGESGVGNPSYTQVDWVRAYQLPPQTNTPVITLTGQDIGTVGMAGSNSVNSGIYTITASGADIWGSADSFRFLYQSMTGDGSIVARVVSITGGSYAKVGAMMRNTLNANSANSFMMTENAEYRTTAGDGTSPGSGGNGAPSWVKVTRAGNVFTTYKSADGLTWSQTSSQSIPMNNTIYVGLAICAHDNTTMATITMDNVNISSTFTQWAGRFFNSAQLADPTASGLTSVPQGDGVPNLLKYLYNIDPSRPMTSTDSAAVATVGTTTVNGTQYLTLTYRRNLLMTGVTVAVQVSTDMQTWTSVQADIDQQIGTDSATGDPIVRVGVNMAGAANKFVRLNVISH